MPQTDEISSAAHAVAAAQAAHERAREVLAEAEAARRQVDAKVDAKQAQIDAIVARHRAGEGREGDGGELELARVDLADLQDLLQQEDGKVAAAMVPVTAAAAALHSAQDALRQLEWEESEKALVAHATTLDGLLLSTVQQITALAAPLGRRRPVWRPSAELAAMLKRVQLAAGVF